MGDEVPSNFTKAQISARGIDVGVAFAFGQRNLSARSMGFKWAFDGAQFEVAARRVHHSFALEISNVDVSARGFEVNVESGRQGDDVLDAKPIEWIFETDRF